MDFFTVVKERRSVRAYKKAAIEREKLQQILEAANKAPSAGNLQAYEVYVVTSPTHKQALAQAALSQGFIAEAPVVLVFCAHPTRSEWRYKERGVKLYSLQDATIACTFAMLAATALNLSSVWVGAFTEDTVRGVIAAPQDTMPIALLPIGYAAEAPSPSKRRSLDDIIHNV